MNYLFLMPKKLSKGASTTTIAFPLGIAYVSAAMKQAGFKVFTANMDFPEVEDVESFLETYLKSNSIDVVCTGGLSLDWYKIKEVFDLSRRINPKVICVAGGGVISSDPQTAMKVLGADIGVIGEGERTMCELAEALDNGKPYGNIPGLIYPGGNGQFVITETRKEVQDLDSFPLPDFEGFNYGQWVSHFNHAGILISDRSCPFRCTFCYHPTGQKYRQRSLDSILMEIEYQIKHFNIKSIALDSELFATSSQRVIEFCERIKKYNIDWSLALRVTDVDRDLLQLMKRSGCTGICFGFESADNTVLKSMRKGITREQIARVLDLMIEVDLPTDSSNFIFGDINETKETVQNTLDFWWKYNSQTHINLCMIQTFPGTYLYEYACEKGIIKDKEQFLRDGCPLINVSKLNDAEFTELHSKITELRIHPHVPAKSLEIKEIKDDKTCKIEYICRKCDTRNYTESPFYFTNTCYCTSCVTKNEVDPFRLAHFVEDEFISGIPSTSKIALWGAGGIYYKLIHKYETLKSDRFLLVDKNEELYGLTICNKIVQAPEVLKREKIKTVIITAMSRLNEIESFITSNYPEVENIFIPSYKITPEGIMPVLETFHPLESERIEL